jgi:hypothetical protein
MWVYLNWALGARSCGADIVWLEGVSPQTQPDEVARLLTKLRENLRPFGLHGSVVLCPWSDVPLNSEVAELSPPLDLAFEADAFIDLVYDLPDRVVKRFRTSALINIDPGLLETWLEQESIQIAEHTAYFTIGARPLESDRPWLRTQPCVALDEWPVSGSTEDAAFTAVTGWYGNEWIEEDGQPLRNDKRSGYLPFLDVPRRTGYRIELAVDLAADPENDLALLTGKGWSVVAAADVASSPDAYRRYIRSSLGEFGCCKPSYARRQTGWISDRTVCYLASGKPAVVQDTGPNPAIDDRPGVVRFRTVDQVAAGIESCMDSYEEACRDARSLAEQHFDAGRVVRDVLERII